jgi:uncharacterized membrane protein YfcA
MPSLSLPHFSVLGWMAVAGGAFAIGLNKGGLTGLGILPVLLFAVVFQARQSTGYVLPLLIAGDICAVVAYRRVVSWPVFWNLLPAGTAGVVLGFLLMGAIPDRVFGPLIGWIILGLITLQFVRGTVGEKLDRFFLSRGFGIGMGVLAGVTTMIANAAGPVASLYFVSVRLPKWNLIGTAAWFFFVINLWKIPFSTVLGLTNTASLSFAVVLAPMVVLGFFAGRASAAIMPEKVFERFVLACTALGALRLIG